MKTLIVTLVISIQSAFLGMAKIKYTADKLNTPLPMMQTWSLQHLNQHKLKLLNIYDNSVNKVLLKSHNIPKKLKKLVLKSYHRLSQNELNKLTNACKEHPQIAKIVELKNKLHHILHSTHVSEKLSQLREWCRTCRETKINCLIEFSSWLESLIGEKQHV